MNEEAKKIGETTMFINGQTGQPAPNKVALSYRMAKGQAVGPQTLCFVDDLENETLDNAMSIGIGEISKAEGLAR